MLSRLRLRARMDLLPHECMRCDLPRSPVAAHAEFLEMCLDLLAPAQDGLDAWKRIVAAAMGPGPLQHQWVGRSLRALLLPAVPAELALEHTVWVSAMSMVLARLFPAFALVLCDVQGTLMPIEQLPQALASTLIGFILWGITLCMSLASRLVPSVPLVSNGFCACNLHERASARPLVNVESQLLPARLTSFWLPNRLRSLPIAGALRCFMSGKMRCASGARMMRFGSSSLSRMPPSHLRLMSRFASFRGRLSGWGSMLTGIRACCPLSCLIGPTSSCHAFRLMC